MIVEMLITVINAKLILNIMQQKSTKQKKIELNKLNLYCKPKHY